MAKPTTYNSEAHRLLHEVVTHSSAELCRLGGFIPQRMSEWKSGRSKPNPTDRQRLESVAGIPARLWDAPPASQPRASKALPTSPDAITVELPFPTNEDFAMGPEGIACVIRRLDATLPQLCPKDRVAALRDMARHVAVHEKLRRDATTARAEYLSSSEFAEDCRALLGAFPGNAAHFRECLSRIGVSLPEAPSNEVGASREPPVDADDLDELISELRVAKEFRDGEEYALSWAHLLTLELDLHAPAIAKLLERFPARATEFLDLLVDVDRKRIQAEFELRLAISDAKSLPSEQRAKVVTLVAALRQTEIAEEIGAAS